MTVSLINFGNIGLSRTRFKFKVGSFNVCLSTSIDDVLRHIDVLYDSYERLSDDAFIDFYVELASPSLARRIIKPQVIFSVDGHVPFLPLPYQQASAMFEWGLNWCIANYSNQYLIIHAAVVELNGQAFILPGIPGSGKSTLCAALVCQGWRLLSDEMALVCPAENLIYPAPRPISLKNQSIPLIQEFSKQAILGQVVNDTAKGTVGHMKPPELSVKSGEIPAKPSKLIFPKYKAESETSLVSLSKARAMLRVIEDCFNYNVLGTQGFECLGNLIDQSDCYEFEYSNLDEALALFTDLAN